MLFTWSSCAAGLSPGFHFLVNFFLWKAQHHGLLSGKCRYLLLTESEDAKPPMPKSPIIRQGTPYTDAAGAVQVATFATAAHVAWDEFWRRRWARKRDSAERAAIFFFFFFLRIQANQCARPTRNKEATRFTLRFLYKVVHKNGRLRKFNRSREIEFNFLTAWTIFMKLGTLVHHVPGYKILPQIFIFLSRDLVMVFQSRKNGVKSSLNFERS